MLDRAGSCRLLGAHPLLLTLAAILVVAVQTSAVFGGPPLGACCLEDIACIPATEEDCIGLGGTWQGEGTVCEAPICGGLPVGACCLVDVCVVTTEAACDLGFGIFQGAGTDCSGEICEVEGACCIGFEDPVCEQLSEAECAVVFPVGRYLGDNTSCADPVCDDSSPTGACCLINPSGFCVDDLTLEACVLIFSDLGGAVWLGPGTTCAEDECPDFGACCLPGGTCVENVSEGLCKAGGGVFNGEGTICAYYSCGELNTPAPCCIEGSCFSYAEPLCLALTGEWFPDLLLCSDDPDLCTKESECPADLNDDGSVGFADLQELLQAWGKCPAEGDCPADLDGDGSVGFGDLTELLNTWGPCPE